MTEEGGGEGGCKVKMSAGIVHRWNIVICCPGLCAFCIVCCLALSLWGERRGGGGGGGRGAEQAVWGGFQGGRGRQTRTKKFVVAYS